MLCLLLLLLLLLSGGALKTHQFEMTSCRSAVQYQLVIATIPVLPCRGSSGTSRRIYLLVEWGAAPFMIEQIRT